MKKVLLAIGFVLSTVSYGQEYPNKPIRLITPAAQGGTTDLLARIFGQKLSEAFGQHVVGAPVRPRRGIVERTREICHSANADPRSQCANRCHGPARVRSKPLVYTSASAGCRPV